MMLYKTKKYAALVSLYTLNKNNTFIIASIFNEVTNQSNPESLSNHGSREASRSIDQETVCVLNPNKDGAPGRTWLATKNAQKSSVSARMAR